MNGDTGALPPAVARLGGAFTDGCVVPDVDSFVDGGGSSSSSSSSPQGSSGDGTSTGSPLLRAASRFWRYQGFR